MPKKKEGYENAAASIFDFIFASSKSKVKPARPPKPSKASGNEMAQGLGEIAMRPLMYAGEQALTPINESLNRLSFDRTTINLDSDAKVKLGVGPGNYSSFLSDPEAFIEKAFTKAKGDRDGAKKLNRIKGIGGAMDAAIAATWAASQVKGGKKQFTAKEAIRFGYDVGNQFLSPTEKNRRAEELAARSSVFEVSNTRQWATKYGLDYDKSDALAKEFYDSLDSTRVSRSQERVKTMGNPVKTEFSQRLTRMGFSAQDADDFASTLVSVHSNREKDKESGLIDRRTKDGVVDLDDSSVRMDSYWSVGSEEKYRKLKMESVQGELKKLQTELMTDPSKMTTDRVAKRDQLQKEFNMLALWEKSNSKDLRFSRIFGETYLQIQTFNEMVVDGGGLTAILNGDFFDDEKNAWSPSEKYNSAIQGFGGSLKGIELRQAKNFKLRGYGALTNMYYLTPGSVMRTLFVNGEGFIHMAKGKQDVIMNSIKGSDDLKDFFISYAKLHPELFDGGDEDNKFWKMLFPGVKKASGVMDFDKGNDDLLIRVSENYNEALEELQKLIGKGDLTDPALLAKIADLSAKIKKLQNSPLLKHAARLNKFWGKINNFTSGKNLAKNLWMKFGGKLLGKKIFEKINLISVSLREVVRTGVKVAVQAILQAIGVATTGGLANILIFIGTEIVFFVGEKLLKPVVKIATFFIWIFTLLVFLIIFGVAQFFLGSSTSEKFDTASYVPPTDIVSCPATLPYEITDEDASGINCNQNAPDISVPGVMGKAEFVSLADRWTSKPGKHYAEECYNDVVCSALSVGMDPAFALMVWINESGASRYGVIPEPIEDFGIHRPDVAKQDFNAQINAFLALSHNYCPELGDPLLGWATMYLSGHCDPDAEVCGGSRCNTGRGYAENMQNVWNWVSGGRAWPSQVKDASRATGQNCGERPKTPGGGNVLPPSQWPPLPPGWNGSCPMGGGNLGCNQGPNGGFSHAAMGSAAIDTTLGTQYWQAPTAGSVSVLTESAICSSDGSNYGGIMWFEGDDGVSYRLIHVAPVVSSGHVEEGEVIARVLTNGELPVADCWTGAHWHLDLKSGGSWINAEEWYRNRLNCNLAACP